MTPEQDIGLIACLTEDELYNGSHAWRAIKPGKVPTLVEQYGRPNRGPDEYCEAIRRFLLPRDHPEWIDETSMWARL